ncbi:MAG: HlyD family secretion protein [Nitrospinae bacterium]|nr:HlyD family secretion protein [Nitrospinota bacterium]
MDEPRRPPVTPASAGEPEELLKARKPFYKRPLLLALGALLLIVGAMVGVRYYEYAVSHEWTDNAFIDGHIIYISSKVAGHVSRVYVADNQEVAQGDLLLELDPREYTARLAQARAALQAAIAKEEAAQAQVELTQVTAEAGVQQAASGVELVRATVETARVQVAVARSRLDQARAQVETASASAAQARAQIQMGTGARFSLLPPENATGNFVKVVQRIPVKIIFDPLPDSDYLLSPGMSVVPVVQVK